MIIGLAGYARVGKDTLADLLVEKHGFEKRSFAQPMREALYALNPMVIGDGHGHTLPLQAVIDIYGWDNYKESVYGPEIRGLMQRFGTEVARKQWGEDFWIKQALAVDLDKDIVFSDVRFENEAHAIRRAGGIVIRLKRDDISPANEHESENRVDRIDPDMIIENRTPLQALSDVIELIEYVEG